MSRDEVMALLNQSAGQHWCDEAHIQRFAHLVYESVFRDANLAASRTILDAAVLEEREACAKVCELAEPYQAADLIRARSNP